jgi:hypothetical protein
MALLTVPVAAFIETGVPAAVDQPQLFASGPLDWVNPVAPPCR